MTTQQHAEALDRETAERMSEAFRRCIETQQGAEELFAPDAFFDIFPPFWRFQIQGPEVFAEQMRIVSLGDMQVKVLRTVPTASGFVAETEETRRGEKVEVARHLWLCEVRDGRITEAVGYCNGPWDDELRARHAAEAPMLRP